MASNAGEKENDDDKPPAIGEKISLLGNGNPPINGSAGDANGADPEPVITRPRRRQRIGSRLAALRAKVESGGATEEEKAEWQEQETSRRDRASQGEKEKPPVSATESPRVKGDWRKKYGDADDGRERICQTVASYWSEGLLKLARYIDDNDGDPFIDLLDRDKRAEFNAVLVLASDDILPPDFKLSAAMIAAGGTSTLIIQAALTARRVGLKKEPQRATVKSDEERAKEETKRAQKIVVEVPVVEVPPEQQAPPKEPDKDKTKPPRERGVI